MSSAVLVHANGFGSLFQSLIDLRMSASSSVTLRCADLRSLTQEVRIRFASVGIVVQTPCLATVLTAAMHGSS
jgi:hypothetical protein